MTDDSDERDADTQNLDSQSVDVEFVQDASCVIDIVENQNYLFIKGTMQETCGMEMKEGCSTPDPCHS